MKTQNENYAITHTHNSAHCLFRILLSNVVFLATSSEICFESSF